MNLAATRSYGVKSTPTNFLIDKAGVILERQMGACSGATLDECLTWLLSN